jgi:hypothetical protein
MSWSKALGPRTSYISTESPVLTIAGPSFVKPGLIAVGWLPIADYKVRTIPQPAAAVESSARRGSQLIAGCGRADRAKSAAG